MGEGKIRIYVCSNMIKTLEEVYGERIKKEHGVMPTQSQLVNIMFHHWKGKEVNVRRKGKCLIIE